MAEMDGLRVGVGVPGRNVGAGEGAGVKGSCTAWFNASKPTAINRENEPMITYQRALTTYF